MFPLFARTPRHDPQPLLEALSASLVPELKRYLAQHRQEALALLTEAGAGAGVAAGRHFAKSYDGLLSSLFHAARAAMLPRRTWEPVSLVAAGSYGRALVAPQSDLDVRLLCKNPARAAAVAEALLYPMWDAGLNLGHQVMTPSDAIDLARQDLPTATSLLDLRLVAGESEFLDATLARAFQGIFGPGEIGAFIRRLEEGASERRLRFGTSVFLLEPDVRNGTGGLRDLDLAHWAARARWRISDLGDLVRLGVLVPREWQQLGTAREFIVLVRALLHLTAGRRVDRLSFDQQERVAIAMGFGSGGAGAEQLMSSYYRHARTIKRGAEMVLERAKPPPRRRPTELGIGNGMKITQGAVSVVDPLALQTDPALALRVYAEAVRRELPVYGFARESIARASSTAGFGEALRARPEAALLFKELCCTIKETKLRDGSVLGELHDAGLLVAMIPEFAPVVGRTHHDIYHVYTVDVHSVAAVDRLRALCRGDLGAEHPLGSRLAAELARPAVLFFATLLHDVGKDRGGKAHSERGAEMAHEILKRLHFDPEDIAEVQQLVLTHLRMYHVATRRDIDDPKTVADFCAEVRGSEGLRQLYLLTVVDVATTSPSSMTTWKARMLDELYIAAQHWLASRLEGGDTEVVKRDERRAELIKEQVRSLWERGRSPEFLEAFLGSMPVRYLHANGAEQIARQARFAEGSAGQPARLQAAAVSEPYVEVWVTADDRPGLLALITSAFSHSRVKVINAQIYSWQGPDGHGRALDLFWVRCGNDSQSLLQALPRIERDLVRLLAGELDAVEHATGRRDSMLWSNRPGPPVSTKVNIDARGATEHTVIEVITKDRRDLLFWLASTLRDAGLTIGLAKVNTEGDRVADVFYVTRQDGEPPSEREELAELEQNILGVISRIENAPEKP